MTQISAQRLRNRSSPLSSIWRRKTFPRKAIFPIAIIIGITIYIFCRAQGVSFLFLRNGNYSAEAAFISSFREQLIQRHNQRRDSNLRELPNHCTSTSTSTSSTQTQTPKYQFKEIIIKGERHTGTNWVRSILEKNVKGDIVVNQKSPDIGWKHGFLPPEGWGRPIEDNDLLLVVTRDAFTWLPKIHMESYDDTFNAKKTHARFNKFIRMPYTAACQPMLIRSKYQQAFCNKLAGNPFFAHDPHDIIAERAKNVVQIRTEKYKQWLSNEPGEEAYRGSKHDYLLKRVHVRLEDLSDERYGKTAKERQERLIADPLWKRCIPVYGDFQETIERTKWGGVRERHKGRSFDANKEKKTLLKRYSKEELRFVLSQLDMEFEKKLGYNYDYVYRLLDSPDVPEKLKERRGPKRVKRQTLKKIKNLNIFSK